MPTCYVHKMMVKDTTRLRTDLVECTSDDDRSWFRMRPIERQDEHGEDDGKMLRNHLKTTLCRSAELMTVR